MSASINDLPAKFLLLDIRYPWDEKTTKNVNTALKNVLLLASCSQGKSKIPAFGLGTIEMDYAELKNFSLLKTNIKAILESAYIKENSGWNSDVELKEDSNDLSNEYKNLLEYAVRRIMKDFLTKYRENFNNSHWPSEVHMILVTKNEKVHNILDVLTKLMAENEFSKLRKIDVIQLISNNNSKEDKLESFSETFDFGKLIVTNDSYSDLDLVFKGWLLEKESRQEDLRLILDSSLDVKCDISDSILSPMILPFGHRFSLTNNLPRIGNAVTDPSIRELEIIERINLSGICSSYIFGRTKKLFPTEAAIFSSIALDSNRKLFKALCIELKNLEQGLLAKLKFGSAKEMSTYFLISSDEEKLYLNNVAPSELILAQLQVKDKNLEIPDEFQSAISRSLLKYPSSEEYLPEKYSSGLYDCIQATIKDPPSKPKNRPVLNTKIKRHKSQNDFDAGIPKGEYVPDFIQKSKDQSTPKKRNLGKNKELDVLHPALLSPEIKAKYRKKDSRLYELSDD